MKVYHTHSGILVAHRSKFYLLEQETWDGFINDDAIIAHTLTKLNKGNILSDVTAILEHGLKAPVQSQENMGQWCHLLQ